MRHLWLVFALLLVAGPVVGCRLDELTVGVVGDPAQITGPRDLIDEAARSSGFAPGPKDFANQLAFVTRMRSELSGIRDALDDLSLRAERCSGAERTDARAALATARGRWVVAMTDLDRASGATRTTWNDRRGGFRASLGELQDAFDITRQELCSSSAL